MASVFKTALVVIASIAGVFGLFGAAKLYGTGPTSVLLSMALFFFWIAIVDHLGSLKRLVEQLTLFVKARGIEEEYDYDQSPFFLDMQQHFVSPRLLENDLKRRIKAARYFAWISFILMIVSMSLIGDLQK